METREGQAHLTETILNPAANRTEHKACGDGRGEGEAGDVAARPRSHSGAERWTTDMTTGHPNARAGVARAGDYDPTETVLPSSRSMARSWLRSSGVTKVDASPLAWALAVRPTRCT